MEQEMLSLRGLCAAAFGLLVSVAGPLMPYVGVCTVMVLTEWLSGRLLRRRRRRRGIASGPGGGWRKAVSALCRSYIAIVLAAMIESVIFEGTGVSCIKFVAGAICFWQGVAILENEADCNDARWAVLAKRLLVRKAEQHLGMDLDLLHKDEIDGRD